MKMIAASIVVASGAFLAAIGAIAADKDRGMMAVLFGLVLGALGLLQLVIVTFASGDKR
jgi:hypothetical protein